MKIKSEREINIIRAKLLVGNATKTDIRGFLFYVSIIEGLVVEASDEDFFGAEGWRKYINQE